MGGEGNDGIKNYYMSENNKGVKVSYLLKHVFKNIYSSSDDIENYYTNEDNEEH